MIVIGDVKLTPERQALLSIGAIIALVDGDHVVRFWLGDGPGVDLMFAEVRGSDGNRFLFGRIRIHADDKLIDSEDHKEVVQVAAPGPEVCDDAVWSLACKNTVMLGLIHGVRRFSEHAVNGDAEAFQREFMRAGSERGFDFGFSPAAWERN